MSLSEERTKNLLEEMSLFPNAKERFEYIIDKYKKSVPLSDDLKIEENLVKGCMSSLWLVAEFKDDKCYFASDADSLITKGVASLVCEFYNGLTPSEVLSIDENCFEKSHISDQLSPNRRNGLSKLIEKIRLFAQAQLIS